MPNSRLSASIVVLIVRLARPGRADESIRSPSTLTALAFFVLPTRVHERGGYALVRREGESVAVNGSEKAGAERAMNFHRQPNYLLC